MTLPAKRHFLQIGTQTVHYRVQGQGPVIVMLHDSPRSSRLHLPTMQRLADRFTLVALDTPGYGNSSPLDIADPRIEDFADSLNTVLCTLGIERAPLYAPHTGAKIALDYAARYGHPARLILDGLSIPTEPTPEDFIQTYMQPFEKDPAGAFIAKKWTHIRDMTRWFPWFEASTATRIPSEYPADWMQDYTIDFLSAGPHYSGAYAAAMRYPPLPALEAITVPTIVGAREDDVLYSSLARVPADRNAALAIDPLPAEPDAWFDWLRTRFAEGAEAATITFVPPVSDPGRRVYVDGPAGQVLVHRRGESGRTPLLLLGAPTPKQALHLADALPDALPVLVPELPGFGESDALDAPSLAGFVQTLTAVIDTLGGGKVDLLARDLATPLALALVRTHPDKIGRLVLDGGLATGSMPPLSDLDLLVPDLPFCSAGSHLMQAWHMLRDSEASWPWYETGIAAQRQLEPLLGADALYDAFLGILKQPSHYGDSVRAAVEGAHAAPSAELPHPCLVFTHDRDPAYFGTEQAAAGLSAAVFTGRPAQMEAAVPAIVDFLKV